MLLIIVLLEDPYATKCAPKIFILAYSCLWYLHLFGNFEEGASFF